MADAQQPAGPQQAGHGKDNLIPGVKYVIAVSSGKGGVGKSTVSVNLAVAMALTGAKVGLLDADIYGPNIPMMMGVSKPPEQKDGKIAPAESHGVKLISMGFFVPEDTAVVWRGPMVHTAIQQLFRDVLWGELDYLLIDLPPGTGDAQLTLTQLVPLTGADHRHDTARSRAPRCPQRHDDVQKGECAAPWHCGEHELLSLRPLRRTDRNIFVTGEGSGPPPQLGVPFLGRVPIDPAIRDGGDSGNPIVVADPASPQSAAFREIAQKIIAGVTGAAKGVPPIESLLSKIKNPFAKT